MTKHVRDAGLESRTARARLKASGAPYYKAVGEGLHLGYRKGATVGKWVVRRYVGNQGYKVETIATADDIEDADGHRVLTFFQAQERARERGEKLAYSGPYRVQDAFKDYLDHLGDRAENTGRRVKNHILPSLGELRVEELTAERIRDWHRGMVRTGEAEAVRKSKCSANRTLTILKSGLNLAFREGKVASDVAWRRVQPFTKVARSRTRYLSLSEVERLLNACTPDFRILVRGAVETGARYGELQRLTCGDFNSDAGTMHIRKSKTGRERHIILSKNGAAFFSHLTAGRSTDAPIFGKVWKESEQTRWMMLACQGARLEKITFHGLRHTWASLAVMAGMPLMIVARNLGHKDTKMVESHYGHLAPSYVVDQVRQFAPDFGKAESNVKALR